MGGRNGRRLTSLKVKGHTKVLALSLVVAKMALGIGGGGRIFYLHGQGISPGHLLHSIVKCTEVS